MMMFLANSALDCETSAELAVGSVDESMESLTYLSVISGWSSGEGIRDINGCR